MIWVMRRVLRDFPSWELSSRIGLLLALALLIVSLGVWAFGAPEVRTPALLSAGALISVAQAIILWANRGLVAPVTAAQRAYLAGEYAAAASAIEPLRAAGKADPRALTLLGNAYRQLGRLDESAAVLYEALDKVPDHHAALYGLGRTLMITGRYTDAAAQFARALDAGSPPIVALDRAEAWTRAGEPDAARAALEDAQPHLATDAPARQLLADLLRYRLGGDAPASDAIDAALPGLRDEAARFHAHPYGAALADDIAILERVLRSEITS